MPGDGPRGSCMAFSPALAEPVNALCEALDVSFPKRVMSVLLHGSVALNDLAIGYSDVDFLVVLRGALSDSDCAQLRSMREPFRSGHHGPLGCALEGAFLPGEMLDPAVAGTAFWWGTSGEKLWLENRLGWFALWVIREKGLLVCGEDIRPRIPPPPEGGLSQQVREFISSARDHGQGGSVKSVDWLLTTARLLKWVELGVMSSKTDAAEWAHIHASGRWREHLPKAKRVRLDTGIAQQPGVVAWLSTLRAPILDALDELASALRARGWAE